MGHVRVAVPGTDAPEAHRRRVVTRSVRSADRTSMQRTDGGAVPSPTGAGILAREVERPENRSPLAFQNPAPYQATRLSHNRDITMRVVITHLTRMRRGYICAAGLDFATGNHVRPM